MTALAEVLAPFQEASRNAGRRGSLTVPSEAIQRGRANLSDLREDEAKVVREARKLITEVKAFSDPVLITDFCDRFIKTLQDHEADAATTYKALRSLLKQNFGREEKALLAELLDSAVNVCEALRDTRWELMAVAANNRPEDDILPVMSVAEIRKLVLAR